MVSRQGKVLRGVVLAADHHPRVMADWFDGGELTKNGLCCKLTNLILWSLSSWWHVNQSSWTPWQHLAPDDGSRPDHKGSRQQLGWSTVIMNQTQLG
jgi:hypothetical protein